VILLTGTSLLACNHHDTAKVNDKQNTEADIKEAWRTWQVISANRSYRFNIKLVSSRPRTTSSQAIITVADGERDIKLSDNHGDIPKAVSTIENIFSSITTMYEIGSTDMTVKFHETYGYPFFVRSIVKGAADSETILEISDLVFDP